MDTMIFVVLGVNQTDVGTDTEVSHVNYSNHKNTRMLLESMTNQVTFNTNE